MSGVSDARQITTILAFHNVVQYSVLAVLSNFGGGRQVRVVIFKVVRKAIVERAITLVTRIWMCVADETTWIFVISLIVEFFKQALLQIERIPVDVRD